MAMTQESNSHDDWEYEYDEHETEVFLVDLDLTTVNRNVKPTTANRHKRLNQISGGPSAKKRKTAGDQSIVDQGSAQPDELDQDDNTQRGESIGRTPLVTALDPDAHEIETRKSVIQVLDLHTSNPIVSYKGQVFSCEWTDMIGTNMFFSQPQDPPLDDATISTNEFDMIGMSRIKLVGRQAKVTPTSQSMVAGGQVDTPDRPGQSLGSIRRSNAKLNADIRKQANFLEQLMNIKKDRGEVDPVQVAMNANILEEIAAGRVKSNAFEREEEIGQLNRRVVRGDAEALRKLEKIYLGQADHDSAADDHVVDLAESHSNTTGRPKRQRRRTQNSHTYDEEVDIEAENDD